MIYDLYYSVYLLSEVHLRRESHFKYFDGDPT